MADLQLRGVCKSFGATVAVQPLDLAINSGELVVLLGPSGAGKTTTLRLVAGLESPDSGQAAEALASHVLSDRCTLVDTATIESANSGSPRTEGPS